MDPQAFHDLLREIGLLERTLKADENLPTRFN